MFFIGSVSVSWRKLWFPPRIWSRGGTEKFCLGSKAWETNPYEYNRLLLTISTLPFLSPFKDTTFSSKKNAVTDGSLRFTILVDRCNVIDTRWWLGLGLVRLQNSLGLDDPLIVIYGNHTAVGTSYTIFIWLIDGFHVAIFLPSSCDLRSFQLHDDIYALQSNCGFQPCYLVRMRQPKQGYSELEERWILGRRWTLEGFLLGFDWPIV